MKIFLDSTNLTEIQEANSTGLLDGVTTNPTLMAKSSFGMIETIEAIASIVHGPISVEVVSISMDAMIEEALKYASIAKNIVIKIPCNKTGFILAQELYKKGIKTNLTLCFSPMQALLAAKSGANFVSPFIGRIDDIGRDGLDLIQDIKDVYDNYGINTQILSASIRTLSHVIECAKIGSDCVTVPYKVFTQMFDNLLTTHGAEIFLKDWNLSMNATNK